MYKYPNKYLPLNMFMLNTDPTWAVMLDDDRFILLFVMNKVKNDCKTPSRQ